MHLRSVKKKSANLFVPAKEKPFCILENTKKILTTLKDKAEKLRGIKDLGNEKGSDAELAQYMRTHTVSVTFEETGLSEEHYFAVTNLINATEWGILCQDLNKPLDLRIVNVKSNFTFGVVDGKAVIPPVLKIPFAEMISRVEKMSNLLFSNWHLDDNSEYLLRVIKSPKEKKSLFHAIKLVEESYGEVVDKFKFDIKCAYDSEVFQINKEQLNTVKTLFTGEPLAVLEASKKMKPNNINCRVG